LSDSEDCDDAPGSESVRVTRANPQIQSTRDNKSDIGQNKPTPANSYGATGNQQTNIDQTQIDLLKKVTAETIAAEFEKFSKKQNSQNKQNQNNKQNTQHQPMSQNQYRPNSNNTENRNGQPDRRACYKCGIVGHIAQFCESFHKIMDTLENHPGTSQQTNHMANRANNGNHPSQNLRGQVNDSVYQNQSN
jgi:hypothetical protein